MICLINPVIFYILSTVCLYITHLIFTANLIFAETCFVRFTSVYLFFSLLGCSANGIAFKIYISIHLLLAYRNITGFYMFIFHFVTFLSLEFLEDFIFCLFFRFLGIFCVNNYALHKQSFSSSPFMPFLPFSFALFRYLSMISVQFGQQW